MVEQEVEWRVINGYENYAVSNTGLVMRLGHIALAQDGYYYYRENHILRQEKTQKGYMRIHLFANNKGKRFVVHRLVAQAFLENKDGKEQVNHIDGNKSNNNVTNLEWVTSSENMQHALRTGLKKYGSTHSMSKLTPDQVRDIRTNCIKGSRKGLSCSDFAKKYGVCVDCVRMAYHGETYKDLL